MTDELFGGSKTAAALSPFAALPTIGQRGFEELIEKAINLSRTTDPFTIPGFSESELGALGGLRDLPGGRQALPQFQQDPFRPGFKFGQRASSAFDQSQNVLSGVQGLIQQGVARIGAEEFGGAFDQFFNPFTEDVIGGIEGDFARTQAREQSNINQLASNLGAFGGSRQALRESELGGEIARAQGAVTAPIRARGFEFAAQQATDQLQQGRNRFLQGAVAQTGAGTAIGDLGSRLFGAREGVQRIQSQQLQDTIANLTARQEAQQTQAEGILAAGTKERSLQVAQQQLPASQLEFLAKILSSIPTGVTGGGSSTTTGIIPGLTDAFSNVFAPIKLPS